VNIHDLEQRVIGLGEDPNNKDDVKSLVKEKDKEIQLLKSKLKISSAKHIQTKEWGRSTEGKRTTDGSSF
jgi:predicted DNA-binding protein (MmcQ/YjbR family)